MEFDKSTNSKKTNTQKTRTLMVERKYVESHPFEKSVYSSCTLVGGDIYVHPGYVEEEKPLYKLSLSTNKWTQVKGCKFSKVLFCNLVEDKLYVVRGIEGSIYSVSFDLALGDIQEYEILPVPIVDEALFLESKRQLVLLYLNFEESPSCLDVYGYGDFLYTKRVTEYIISGEKPHFNYRITGVACQDKVFCYTKNMSGPRMYVLTVETAVKARWEHLAWWDTKPPIYLRCPLLLLDGFIVYFGSNERGGSARAYSINPRTRGLRFPENTSPENALSKICGPKLSGVWNHNYALLFGGDENQSLELWQVEYTWK